MNIVIRVNILPWNEIRAEYVFPVESEESKEELIFPLDLTLGEPIQPTSEPYIPPPSSTIVERSCWNERKVH